MKRASFSFSSSLGVVPLAMSAWKPLMAPQAMVMNTNGNTLPANTGPVPSMNGVTAGIWMGGSTMMMPAASATTTPIFTNALR
jgi:hypothetical protein